MKKLNLLRRLLFLAAMVCFVPTGMNAQVTIGSGAVPRATLDVVPTNTGAVTAEGIIAPNLTGDQIKGKDAQYTAAQRGAVVYATAAVGTASTKTANITAAGYYYFDGLIWQKMSGGAVGDGNTTYTISAGDGTAGAVRLTPSSGAAQNITVNVNDADYIIGNEVTNATNTTLVRTGSGTVAAPYTLARAAITGDVSVPAASNAATVTRIQGNNVSATAPTAGQVLKWNATTGWTPAADAGLTAEVDGIIGNEVTNATANGGLTRAGSGTAAAPYTLGLTAGTANGQVMKWNGTAWAPAADAGLTAEVDGIIGNEVTNATNTTLVRAGSGTAASPYTLARAAIVGDITIAAGSNTAAIGTGKVTSTHILDGTVATADIANNAVTIAKIAGTGKAANTFLNGLGNWVTPTDNNTTYSAANGLTLNVTPTPDAFELGGTLNRETIITQAAHKMKFTSTVTDGFSVDGTTFSVDAANKRVGIGLNDPRYTLQVDGSLRIGDNFTTGTAGFGNCDKDGFVVGGLNDIRGQFLAQRSSTNPTFYLSKNSTLMGGVTAGTNYYYIMFQLGYTDDGVTNATPNAIGSIVYRDGQMRYNATSDKRLKENIISTHYGISDLMRVKVRDFNFKKDENKIQQTGFIAQELYDVYPEAVSKPNSEEEESWSVDYGKVTPLLVKAIQDQQVTIEALTKRIEELENQ